ncbi:hypothetical protein C1645_876913 [Glomus cerebriforme]|uniref:Galactose oxidase n=1 Tax=Glomus cerebriforme TaxID=658196 RepID=A0A397SWU4_9GLOM|nr:hypothetical protein C1645_876913 [Glomus cerebriforme]
MVPFKPKVLYQHTATLIENKLYILGGSDSNDQFVGKTFFYLDVSVPFDTQKLLWQDLSNVDLVPPHALATSVKGGVNNDTLFLYGGMSPDNTMALVYTFDSRAILWDHPNMPKIVGSKFELTGVNNNGKMYLWGGANDTTYFNDMLILDTINLSWGKGSLDNAPTPRCDYGATLLPNNNIIYIGGSNFSVVYDPDTLNVSQGSALALNEVYLYDTINDNWSIKVTSGKIPSNRAAFSTVLGLDGQRIIIFGGYFKNPGYLDTTLYVLDLTNFNWYIPKISGKIPNPRVYHKADVIGKFMVISFGYGPNKQAESDILLLDISNNEEYIWTTKFDPSVPNLSSSPPSTLPSPSTLSPSTLSPTTLSSSNLPLQSPSPSNKLVIIGTSVAFLVGGIILTVGGFFLYKWNKNKLNRKNIIRIQGNEN